jgi:hypothetical protein
MTDIPFNNRHPDILRKSRLYIIIYYFKELFISIFSLSKVTLKGDFLFSIKIIVILHVVFSNTRSGNKDY